MVRYFIAGFIVVAIAVLIIAYAGLIPLGDGDSEGGDGSAELGQSIYQQQCFGCHSNDGSTSAGPSFQSLYGSEVTMEDGTTVVVDDEHIVESVRNPQANVREGYPSVMPSFNDLNEDQLAGIVAYIQSLK